MAARPAAGQTWAGGTGNWNVAANWVGGIVPNSETADVQIDGGDANTSSSVTIPHSLDFWSVRALTIDAGDTLTNNVYVTAFGPVTVDGTLNLFSGPAALFIDSPSPVTVEGGGTIGLGYYSKIQARNGLSIGPGILVQGAGTIDGGGTRKSVTNLGTIRAQGGPLEILNFTNRGSVEVRSGGTLQLGNALFGAWRNEGTIDLASGSTLKLGGTFAASDLGTIPSQPGTRTVLIGTFDNTGNVLDLGKTIGTLNMMSNTAAIIGGTITASGDARFVIGGNPAGVLDGVTLATDPVFEHGNYLAIRNGLVLNDVVLDLSNGGTMGNGVVVAGTGTLAGRGEVKLGSFISESQYYTGNHLGGLTIAPDIFVHGAGGIGALVNYGRIAADVRERTLTLTAVTNKATVTVAPAARLAFTDSTNEGTISVAAGATISLIGNWRNPGTIAMAGSSNLIVSGPFATRDLAGLTYDGPDTTATFSTTVDNTADDLDAAAIAQTLILKGSTILGGTLSASHGSRLVIASPTPIKHTNLFDGVTLKANPGFADALAEIEVRHGLTLANATVDLSTGGTLTFGGDQPQTLGGNGQVIVWGPLKNKGRATVTIGPDILVRGHGTISGPFVNQGHIQSDPSGMSLANLVNVGTIRAADRTSIVVMTDTAVENRGIIRVDAGGTFRPYSGTFTQTSGSLNVNGVLNGDGTLTLAGGTLSGTGVVRRSAIPYAPPPPLIPDDGSLVISPGASLDGLGSLGTLQINDPVGFNVPEGARVVIELGPDDASDVLKFEWGDLHLADGSSLDVATLGDVPLGSQFVIATYYGSLTGTFTHVPPNLSVSYDTPHEIIVTLIPEPECAGLAGCIATFLLRRRRRSA